MKTSALSLILSIWFCISGPTASALSNFGITSSLNDISKIVPAKSKGSVITPCEKPGVAFVFRPDNQQLLESAANTDLSELEAIAYKQPARPTSSNRSQRPSFAYRPFSETLTDTEFITDLSELALPDPEITCKPVQSTLSFAFRPDNFQLAEADQNTDPVELRSR